MNCTGADQCLQLTYLSDANNFGIEANELWQFEMLCIVHNVLLHLLVVGVVGRFLWERVVRKTVIVLGHIAENRATTQTI